MIRDKKKTNTITLNELKDKYYGEPGALKRDELNQGFQAFKIGAMLKEASNKIGRNQQELADKVVTTKSYI